MLRTTRARSFRVLCKRQKVGRHSRDNRSAEAERSYGSALRAVQCLTGIIRGDQSAGREDNLRQFFPAT
jgi:hypothetical protein